MEQCEQACGRGCGANSEVGRRNFVKAAITGLGALWAMMAAYPIYRYLMPNGKDDDSQTKVSSVTVGAVDSVPRGTGKNFRFGSTPAILTHTNDGEFHAFNAICTHLGCTVQYREDKSEIWCACHGGCYDASSGKNIAGPPPKPLTALKVNIVDGKIVVSKA